MAPGKQRRRKEFEEFPFTPNDLFRALNQDFTKFSIFHLTLTIPSVKRLWLYPSE
jgi:hypothetical protein